MAAVLAGGFYANDSGRRLFLWAMAGSLTLHLAVLFILPVLQEAQRARPAPPSLTARLAKPKPPDPAPPAIEPLMQPQVRPLAARPGAIAKTGPQPAVPPASLPAVISTEKVTEPDAAVLAAQQTQAVTQIPVARAEAQSAVPAAGGADPGTVARFRLELMDVARRYKKYPRIAQDNNWQGRVELRIAIGADGAISALTVKKGAGRAALDDEAQAMIRTAQAKTAIPPALRGKAFTLEIPVDFFLQDEEK